MRLIEPEQITKMMSDLFISEDAVNMTGERQGLWVRFRAIEKAVSEIPTIDAIPVVRCKECKYLRIDSDFMKGRYCAIRNVNGGGFCKDEDFCSYGKRREDGEA